MWRCLLILIFPSIALQAACIDNFDASYDLAVRQGNYALALDIVARDLRVSADEARHFKIIHGFSRAHDDRHGQADPESLELRLDPELFQEGKEGACQGVAHELTHLRQFERDRRHLHAFFSKSPVPKRGWADCDREQRTLVSPQQAEQEAYDCLQDNDLVPHAAAEDIEAILAQIPYARAALLRDDDLRYLVENLNLWAQHQNVILDHANESYYLPEVKREDIRFFCQGIDHARLRHINTTSYDEAAQHFCRGV